MLSWYHLCVYHHPRIANFIDHFAATALGHIDREYPSKLDHVVNDECDLLSPRALHPAFFGSFDWHSSVHAHWLLARALRLAPDLQQAGAIIEVMDRHLTPDNVTIEVAYLKQPRRATFERTYGWAWLLKLAAELSMGKSEADHTHTRHFARWADVLDPLARAFVDRYLTYLPKATYPIRVGTHTNTAFGLALALDYAKISNITHLTDLLTTKARAWYGNDLNCPVWEPDGTDFFSPALMETECMRRVLDPAEFIPWLNRFLPNLAARQPATLFIPATVSDRTDGQITHLDGLNLSRAWCWRALSGALPADDSRRDLAEESAAIHLEAALPHVTGDYMGEHWLATFALLAMTE